MRRMLPAAIALVLCTLVAGTAFLLRARAADTAPVTLSGTLIDTRCYSMDAEANKGVDHKTASGTIKQCARMCASSGIPVALLDADGKVTILVAPSTSLAPHMGKEARLTGIPVLNGAVRPTKLEVKKGQAWTEVNLAVMM